MAITHIITIGDLRITQVDSDPTVGLDLPIGSLALWNNAGVGQLFVKTATSSSAWSNSQVIQGSGSSNQLLGVNAAGTANEFKTLTPTTNQVNVTHGVGTITLSTPQNIHTAATPTFNGLTLSNLTIGSVPFIGTSGLITQDNTNLFFDNSAKKLGIGTASPNTTLDISGDVSCRLGGDYTSIGTQNNVSTAGFSYFRFDPASALVITGFANGFNGKDLYLANVSSQSVSLTNNDSNSSAANRILTNGGGTTTIPQNTIVQLKYDSTSSNWRQVNLATTPAGTGITSLNGLTSSSQTFATATTGSDFSISSSVSTHTFAIPDAGTGARGLVTTGTQTFAGAKTLNTALTISPTTNQLVLGVTNTTTITSPAPSSSRVYTIEDMGTNASFVMTEASQTINGTKTFSSAVVINPVTNQLILGVTNTTTINSTAPSASRTHTIPDPGTNANFVMSEGTQTINGAKTFSSALKSTTSLVLEDPGAGTNTTTIQSGTVGTNYTLTLPTNVATFNSAAIVSDTSGVLRYVPSGYTRFTTTATSAGTITLTTTSDLQQELTGSTLGQVINLGDATTYDLGRRYRILNSSTQMIQIVNSGSTELNRLGPNESCDYTLTVNGTASGTWKIILFPVSDSRYAAYIYDDFVAASNTGQTNWVETKTGTSSGTSVDSTNATSNHPGVLLLTKGTTAAGRASSAKAGQTIFFGSGVAVFETLFNLTTLSDGTNTYINRIGWGDTPASGDMVDGVYFEYDSTTSANWLIKTANNSTRTTTTSSTAVAAGSWLRLRIEVNADGTRADFFVNGVNVGNITTNIPTTAARQTAIMLKVEGSAGTSARNFQFDYANEIYYFGSARG